MRPTDDDGSGANPGIDTLITLVDIPSGSDFSSVTLMGGTFSTMTVSFRVMCTGNSMGPDCSICREGFQNPASGCTETCTPAQGCCKCVESRLQLLPVLMLFIARSFPTAPIGGFCNAPDVCVCRDGYSGDDCDVGRMRLSDLAKAFIMITVYSPQTWTPVPTPHPARMVGHV